MIEEFHDVGLRVGQIAIHFLLNVLRQLFDFRLAVAEHPAHCIFEDFEKRHDDSLLR